jgi:hypothetical protein
MPDGKISYVECERNTYKKPEQREHKWDLYYEASNGRFFIVTESEEDRRTIQEEVEIWAGNHPLELWVAGIEEKDWLRSCPILESVTL